MTLFKTVNLKMELMVSLRLILFSKYQTGHHCSMSFGLKTPGD